MRVCECPRDVYVYRRRRRNLSTFLVCLSRRVCSSAGRNGKFAGPRSISASQPSPCLQRPLLLLVPPFPRPALWGRSWTDSKHGSKLYFLRVFPQSFAERLAGLMARPGADNVPRDDVPWHLKYGGRAVGIVGGFCKCNPHPYFSPARID